VIGRQVSHFYVIRGLGSGGMGDVYEAQDTRLPRSVAIKFLKPALSRNIPAVRRFKREARLAAALNHPNICTVFDVDEGDDQSFIAMELLEGLSLKDRLAAGPLLTGDVVDIGMQVVDALAAAHGQDIMHRDITPGNIFITVSGLVKVLDFGLAKHFGSGDDDSFVSTGVTEPGTIVGTIHYMAPEQFGDAMVDHRCDLFSLGAVMYQMATGSRPFQAKSKDEIVTLIREQPHLPLRQLAPHQSVELEAIVDKLLAKRPDDRYQTAAAVRADLSALKRSRGREGQPTASAVTPGRVSLAILPFEILGAHGGEIEQFRDGLGVEIASRLSEIPEMHVAPRTSTRQVMNEAVREIGRRLNVQLIVEGSVQQASDRVKVVVNILNAADERSMLPAIRVEQPLREVFVAQDAIGREIAAALAAALVRFPGAPLTSNPDAYQAFKRGQHYWKTPFSGGWRPALEQFKYAIECDDRFALAHAALGAVYNFLGFYGHLKPTLAFSVARRSLERAVEIDETLAMAHAELGLMKFGGDWDWDGAEGEFRRALKLDPACAIAHAYYSWLLVLLGREDAGLAEARAAQAHAPSKFMRAAQAQALYIARHFDEAIALCAECLDTDGDYPYALHLRAQCLRETGMHADALRDLEHAARVTQRAPFYLGLLGHCYGYRGMRQEAKALLAELDQREREIYVPPQCYVYTYAGLGYREKALEYQEKAYEDGASPLNYLTPFIRDLYALDPGQQQRLEQMRLAL
jgi:TolB-like protein/tetratricopeptide (TPR) repeat protein